MSLSATSAALTAVATSATKDIVQGNDPDLGRMAVSSTVAASGALAGSAGGEAMLHSGSDLSAEDMQKERIVHLPPVDGQVEGDIVYVHQSLDPQLLEDLSQGKFTFDTFRCAICDIINTLTFGLFKPQLLEIKFSHHVRTEAVVFHCKTKGKPLDELKSGESSVTEVECISVEVNPDVFGLSDEELGREVDRLKDHVKDKADHVRVYREEVSYKSETDSKENESSEYHIATKRTTVKDGEGNVLEDNEIRHESVRATSTSQEKVEGPTHASTEQTGRLTGKTTEQTESTVTSREKVVTFQQTTTIDHLANKVEKSSLTGVSAETVTTDHGITTTESSHLRIFGVNLTALGKQVQSETRTGTEKVTGSVSCGDSTDDISSLRGKKVDEIEKHVLVSETAELEGSEQGYTREVSGEHFESGWICYVPGGNLVEVAVKSGLGANISTGDIIWAGVDTASIIATVATGGLALGVATAAKSGARVAAKGGAKLLGKLSGKIAKQAPKVGSRAAEATTPMRVVSFKPKGLHGPTTQGTYVKRGKQIFWEPDPSTVPTKFNPAQKTMGTMLRENGYTEGRIAFVKGRPNFDLAAKRAAEILDRSLPGARPLPRQTFRPKIDWTKRPPSGSWTRPEIREAYRQATLREVESLKGLPKGSVTDKILRELKLTVHEPKAGVTQLMPQDLHASIWHKGGVSETFAKFPSAA